MIFDHGVKYNGNYYAAGIEVPENEEPLLSESAELDNSNIVLETDSAVDTKNSSRRGRPKKAE